MPPAFSASRAGVMPKAGGDPSSLTLANKYAPYSVLRFLLFGRYYDRLR